MFVSSYWWTCLNIYSVYPSPVRLIYIIKTSRNTRNEVMLPLPDACQIIVPVLCHVSPLLCAPLSDAVRTAVRCGRLPRPDRLWRGLVREPGLAVLRLQLGQARRRPGPFRTRRHAEAVRGRRLRATGDQRRGVCFCCFVLYVLR